MRNNSETWVGAVLGLVVTLGVLGGAYRLLSGDDVIVESAQPSSGTEATAQVAGPEANTNLQSLADTSRSDPDAAESALALRVVTDSSSSTTAPTTTEESTTTSEPPTTAAPTTAALTTAGPTTAPPSSTTTAPPSAESDQTTSSMEQTTTTASNDARTFERQVIDLTNVERSANGCAPLSHNGQLQAAALGHSKDMQQQDYFDHTSLDGSGMADRINRQGYQWRQLAENIAYGYRTAGSVVDGWMNSSGHRANILNCDLTEIGVGFHDFYWTQNFGTPAR